MFVAMSLTLFWGTGVKTEESTPLLVMFLDFVKQRGLRGLLYRWPSITEWEVHITAQGPPSPK